MDGDQTPGEGSQRCAGVFLVSDESVLFGRRSAAKSWSPGVWDVIGGRVEQDESYVAAACREVNEELGVTVEPEDLHHLETVISSDFELAVFATSRWTGTVTNVAVDEHDVKPSHPATRMLIAGDRAGWKYDRWSVDEPSAPTTHHGMSTPASANTARTS